MYQIAIGDYSLKVYNFFGVQVYESAANSADGTLQDTISLIGWKTGIYEVVISNGNHRYSKKVIVR